eukprot:Gb_22358 [translate_table: standard]
MAVKYLKGLSGGSSAGCCDMSLKCRCRWGWDSPPRFCVLYLTFIYFLGSFMLFGATGMLYAWMSFSEKPGADALGCREDDEGSWSIGVFRGSNPFALHPIEMENIYNNKSSAWPVANPVLTCGSVSDGSHLSNFVADPFLYIQGAVSSLFFRPSKQQTSCLLICALCRWVVLAVFVMHTGFWGIPWVAGTSWKGGGQQYCHVVGSCGSQVLCPTFHRKGQRAPSQGDVLYLFFETKNAITMQGDIGVAKSLDQGATWKYLGIALDEEWHLSYPYVFDYDGQVSQLHLPFLDELILRRNYGACCYLTAEKKSFSIMLSLVGTCMGTIKLFNIQGYHCVQRLIKMVDWHLEYVLMEATNQASVIILMLNSHVTVPEDEIHVRACLLTYLWEKGFKWTTNAQRDLPRKVGKGDEIMIPFSSSKKVAWSSNFLRFCKIYMMPEGSKKGDLRLYRALNFPLQWTLEKVLLKKPLVDAFMIKYSDLYWIFGSDHSRFGSSKNGELEIWYASSPLGQWKQHKSNPVRNGDKSLGARNAGRPFMFKGHLYRLGQDCGETYGRRVRAFRVEILTKEKYREVEVPLGIEESKKVQNAWNGIRYHHLDAQQLNSGRWIAVMDGDRVKSGHLTERYILGSVVLIFLVLLIILVAVLVGVVRCIFPLSRCLSAGKRSDTLATWVHPQITSKLHRAFSWLNRSSSALRGTVKLKTCAGALLLFGFFLLGVILICVIVQAFFGGNGAEEPYTVDGTYSQFTLLTMTYEARLWNLKMYIKHYSRCASVREIVVVWNKGQPPNPETDFDSTVPVRIRVEKQNSLNNRFKPDPLIKTKAVFELDDDIMMTCNDVERGFKAWREQPDQIVGFYPRLIDGSSLKYRGEKYARARKGYNIILTGAAFLDSEFAFEKYWSDEAKEGRLFVDKVFNCEDILMNFLFANGSSPRTVEYVHPAWAVDTSKFSTAAISRDTQMHYRIRTNCLLKFSQLYGNLPLKKWEFGSRKDGWDH